MSQAAFCMFTQPWKPWEHWESAHWHRLTLKCVNVLWTCIEVQMTMPMSMQKCVCFLLDLLNGIKFSPQSHMDVGIRPYWMLSLFSCTPHDYFWNPTFVSSSVSFIPSCILHTFSLNFCVSMLQCVPLNYTEDSWPMITASLMQTFLGLSGR